jgi:hypothetical protein
MEENLPLFLGKKPKFPAFYGGRQQSTGRHQDSPTPALEAVLYATPQASPTSKIKNNNTLNKLISAPPSNIHAERWHIIKPRRWFHEYKSSFLKNYRFRANSFRHPPQVHPAPAGSAHPHWREGRPPCPAGKLKEAPP